MVKSNENIQCFELKSEIAATKKMIRRAVSAIAFFITIIDMNGNCQTT